MLASHSNSFRPRSFLELAGLLHRVAPFEYKWGIIALPLVGFIAWNSWSETLESPTHVQKADVVAASIPPLEASIDDRVAILRKKIAERAEVNLGEDFRDGLLEWDGVEDWGRSWKHDIVLGVKPSKLAVYKPSILLKDYKFEFLGQIEKKALTWVFRAADLKNYYVMKLVQISDGPMPAVRVVRYAVVGDKPEVPVSSPLPYLVTKDTVYRVNLDVKGDHFTLYIDGKVADVWFDDRFKSGGVGFFSSKDEESRILTMRVTSQSNNVGKAAAYLSKSGSTK